MSLFIISIVGILNLNVENSFINYFKKDTEIFKGMKLIDQNRKFTAMRIAKEDFKMEVSYKKNTDLNPLSFRPARGILSFRLRQALEGLKKPFFYDLSNLDQGAKIAIQLDQDLLIINVNKDRLYSESAFVFLLWMIFASLVLLIVAFFFMKGQIRPLKRLSIFAEAFGKDPKFFSFMRSMEAYKKSLKTDTTLLMSDKSDFLGFLNKSK